MQTASSASRAQNLLRIRLVLVAVAIWLGWQASTAQAARVTGARLLPRNTYLYVEVASVPDLVATFQETNLGRMIADPQIKPFLDKLYASANQFLEQFRERTGYSIEELAKIPSGEITFAMAPVEAQQVAMVLLVDCGDSETAKKLIDRMYAMSEEAGAAPQQEKIDGATIFSNRASGPVQVVYFERDATVAVTSSIDTAKELLTWWDRGVEDSLADNARYKSIMDRCRGTKDETPQIVFFADPLEMLWDMSKFNAGLQIGLRFLPVLGLDGLKGVGGSMVLATEEFDSIIHAHVLLDSPRQGVLEVAALDSGDDTPPTWVPDDVGLYSSWHINAQAGFDKGTKLADTFRFLEEGTTAKRINDSVRDALGIDVTEDILPSVTGRLIHINRFSTEPPFGLGPANLYAIELKDGPAFKRLYDKLLDKLSDRFEREPIAGLVYYRRNNREPDDPRPQTCLCLMDNWMLLGDRAAMMEYILRQRSETTNRLADSLEFKLITSKISRQPGGAQPSMMSFERPEAGLRYVFDLAQSERTRERLREGAENNPVFRALNEGLTDNPLPPWSAFERYLAPQGSMIVNDDSGIHYMQFSLRRK